MSSTNTSWVLLIIPLAWAGGCISHRVQPPVPGFFEPTLAAAIAIASGDITGPNSPTPPAPLPDGPQECPDCNGKGWVGDATIMNPCAPCNGTGVITIRQQLEALNAEQEKLAETQVAIEALDTQITDTNQRLTELEAKVSSIPIKKQKPFAESEFESVIEEARKQDKPILLGVWNVETITLNARTEEALAKVTGLDDRFIRLNLEVDQYWNEEKTVAVHFGLKTYTSLWVIDPKAMKFTQILSLKELE